MGYIVEVIRGAANQRIKEQGHDQLPVYGIGREHSHEHWVSVLRQLIHLGLVTQNISQHSALQLTEAARPVLRAEHSLMLAVPRLAVAKPRLSSSRLAGGITTVSYSLNCVSCVKLSPMRRVSPLMWCLTTRR